MNFGTMGAGFGGMGRVGAAVGSAAEWVNPLALASSMTPNYVVDPNLGSDTNAGTVSAPFATITKLRTTLEALGNNSTKIAFIKGATYTDQNLDISNASSGLNFTLVFDIGASIVWTQAVDKSGIQLGALAGNELHIYGNGYSIGVDSASKLLISGFLTGTGNGIGCNNSDLWVDNVNVTNCVDGLSGHGGGDTHSTNCIFENCTKSAFAHIGTGAHETTDCDFIGRSGASSGIGQIDATNSLTALRCRYIPITAGQVLTPQAGQFTQCEIGTTSLRAALATYSGAAFTDCFFNLTIDANFTATFTSCYGKFSARDRGAPATADMVFRNCIFVGPATGLTGCFYANFDDGGGSWDGIGYDMRDCIITGYVTAIGGGFTANQFTKWNSNSKLDNICTFGNTTGIHASITTETNELTSNPQIGAANTTAKTDYGYAPGSPCIGAGFGGGNIGFAA